MKHYIIPAEDMIETCEDLEQAIQFRNEMIRQKRLSQNSFYGKASIEEANKKLQEVPTFPELLETIMLYQEALEAMTAERNKYYKEWAYAEYLYDELYEKIDCIYEELL